MTQFNQSNFRSNFDQSKKGRVFFFPPIRHNAERGRNFWTTASFYVGSNKSLAPSPKLSSLMARQLDESVSVAGHLLRQTPLSCV
jgi:hypothetical protein